MVAEETREARIERLNYRLGDSGYVVAVVPVAELLLLEKNARYMPNEQFRNLVSNIKKDKGLSSVPFCVREAGGGYTVLSGNHRVMAAKEAGFTELLILYSERAMTAQERVAVQLSHNSIAGQDDLRILKELYAEIEDVGLKYYAGLDDTTLDNIEKLSLPPLSEIPQEYRQLSFVFLPEEAERLEAVFEEAVLAARGERAFACRYGDYDRLLDTLAAVKEEAGVKNTATALMLILDIYELHAGELPEIIAAKV